MDAEMDRPITEWVVNASLNTRPRGVLRGLDSIRVFAATAALIFASCVRGNAQTDLAAITGTVTDSTGAVVSGCHVEAKDTGTSATRTTSTNTQGDYSIPLLRVGSYELTVSAAGFQSVQSTIELALSGATANFQLHVASTSSQVTVNESSAQIQLQTDSHDVSQLVSSTAAHRSSE